MAKLYSSLKFMLYPEYLEALRSQSLLAPLHIRLKPINLCNHDCWYCAYRVSSQKLGEDMNIQDKIPEDKMFEIADDIIAMGTKAVTFSGGGEPLLYKPLPEVIERLAKGGVKIAALTNGSNLKGKVADAFAQHATWIRISADGWDDESYSKMRGIEHGAFSKLLDNLRRFSMRGSKCVLGISFIVCKENYQHIYDACVLFKEAGVNHVSLSGVVTSNEGSINNSYHREISEEVFAQIARANTLSDDNFLIINRYHELDDRFDKTYTMCPTIQFTPVIGADCCVYTCHDKAYTDSGLLGSIKVRRLKEFWFSEENRQRIYNLDPSKVCTHHCVAHLKNATITEILSLDTEHGAFV